jgi:hypothetical protein
VGIVVGCYVHEPAGEETFVKLDMDLARFYCRRKLPRRISFPKSAFPIMTPTP